jgi:hypothetical protein
MSDEIKEEVGGYSLLRHLVESEGLAEDYEVKPLPATFLEDLGERIAAGEVTEADATAELIAMVDGSVH